MNILKRSIVSKIYQLGCFCGNTIVNKIPINILRKIYFRLLGAKFGKKTILFRRVEILKPLTLRIGESSSVGWFTLLDARGGITIGENVTVASYCKLVTGTHDIESPQFTGSVNPIIIKDYAWVCTGAIILGGVTIGRGAVVAAGAVVTKDVPDMTVVGGVPAKVIKKRLTEPIFHDDMKWAWLN